MNILADLKNGKTVNVNFDRELLDHFIDKYKLDKIELVALEIVKKLNLEIQKYPDKIFLSDSGIYMFGMVEYFYVEVT